MLDRFFRKYKSFTIDSPDKLEEAVVNFGILPFFRNNVKGLSVEEMCSPGRLFGGNYDDGCWEWKGPVIRRKTTAYGKFFRRKAGFISLKLLPNFIEYRRAAYPLNPDSTEQMLLDIIKENEGLSSTDLKTYIFGKNGSKREWHDLPDSEFETKSPIRKSLETPLQKLQMGGWIIISDFVYKHDKRGQRYGWGVATYSTPELIFNIDFKSGKDVERNKSLDRIIQNVINAFPSASVDALNLLLK